MFLWIAPKSEQVVPLAEQTHVQEEVHILSLGWSLAAPVTHFTLAKCVMEFFSSAVNMPVVVSAVVSPRPLLEPFNEYHK